MSRYVLDTDIVSLFQRNHPQVAEAILKHPPSELAISVLTVEEQLSGWYTLLRQAKSPSSLAAAYQRMTHAAEFFGRFRLLTFSEAAIEQDQELQRLKLGLTKIDPRIASVVLDHGSIPVTRNTRDFERVPDLKIEDWSK